MLTPQLLVQEARSLVSEISNQQLLSAIENNAIVIDVREPNEFALGAISNAINIPRGLIEFAIFDHPQVKPRLNSSSVLTTPIYLYCKSGGRSALSAKSLNELGFSNVYSLAAGIMGWESEGLKISQPSYNY